MADIQRAAPTNLQTMKNVIEKYSTQIQALIPKHVTGERIVNIALTALTRNPDLLECDPRTVLAGIIQASILGLELHSPLHHASLVKFWNLKASINEAQLMIEYAGLIELVSRGGETSYVEAQAVYQNDEIDVVYGDNPHLIHRPQIRASRGKLIGAYAYAKLRDGSTKFHYMTDEEIQKRRNFSKAKDSGPWKTWEEEMYAKTPLRHLCKQLRKTTELSMALEHENRFDQGIGSVVENGEGLSMDFLSMNIEAKTLESKQNLRGKLEAQTQSTRQQPVTPAQNAQAPSQPPPATRPSTAPPAGTPPSNSGLEETRRRIAEVKAQEDAAAAQQQPPTEEAPGDHIDALFDEVEQNVADRAVAETQAPPDQTAAWNEYANEQPATNAAPQPPPASRPPAQPRQTRAQQPTPQQAAIPTTIEELAEQKISKEERDGIMKAITENKIAPTVVRAFFDSIEKGLMLAAFRKKHILTFNEWIKGGTWKQQ